MRFTPLGDQAVLIYLDDEMSAFAFAAAVRNAGLSWSINVVQAYASVAVFFDPSQIDYEEAERRLSQLDTSGETPPVGRHHRIPCCYELQLDLRRVADCKGLSPDQVIEAHQGSEYVVYAIGFCPGFPYLGYLPKELEGVPRLESPRLRVEAGSVGLTGRQTGIYTEPRPGGWNLIGRTPLELVNVEDNYFPLRTGDRVTFARIDERDFRKLLGNRL